MEFKKEEFENIIKIAKNKNYQVVMTEKDYFKIESLNLKYWISESIFNR